MLEAMLCEAVVMVWFSEVKNQFRGVCVLCYGGMRKVDYGIV